MQIHRSIAGPSSDVLSAFYHALNDGSGVPSEGCMNDGVSQLGKSQ